MGTSENSGPRSLPKKRKPRSLAKSVAPIVPKMLKGQLVDKCLKVVNLEKKNSFAGPFIEAINFISQEIASPSSVLRQIRSPTNSSSIWIIQNARRHLKSLTESFNNFHLTGEIAETLEGFNRSSLIKNGLALQVWEPPTRQVNWDRPWEALCIVLYTLGISLEQAEDRYRNNQNKERVLKWSFKNTIVWQVVETYDVLCSFLGRETIDDDRAKVFTGLDYHLGFGVDLTADYIRKEKFLPARIRIPENLTFEDKLKVINPSTRYAALERLHRSRQR